MQGIRRIPLDNPIFLFFRKLVYKMDNMLFNHKNSIGQNYEPTQYMLVFPYWAGVVLTILLILFSSKLPPNSKQLGIICLGSVETINVLFMFKRIINMPTRAKQFFYLIFTIIITTVFLSLVVFLVHAFLMIFITLLVLYFAFCCLTHAPSSSSGSGSSDGYREEVVVDDGSILGKTLHRNDNDSYGTWRDSSGTQYEETSEGFRKK